MEHVYDSTEAFPSLTGTTPGIAAKWAFPLAVVGFSLSALFVVLGLTGGFWADSFSYYNRITQAYDPMSPDFSLFMSAAFLLMAVVYFFPSYYLWGVSGRIRSAFRRGDKASLKETCGSAKGHIVFVVILFVIAFFLLAAGVAAVVLG